MEIKIENIKKSFEQSSAVILQSKILSDKIKESVEIIVNAIQNGNKVLIFGNGGSAADAQHMAAEFIGRYYFDRISLPAIALTTDTSIFNSRIINKK